MISAPVLMLKTVLALSLYLVIYFSSHMKLDIILGQQIQLKMN